MKIGTTLSLTLAAAGLLALAAPAHAQRRGGQGGGNPGMTMNHGGGGGSMNHGGMMNHGGNFHGGHYYGNRYYRGGYYGSGVNFYVGGFGYPYYGYTATYTYDPQRIYQGRVVNQGERRTTTTREVDPKDQSSTVEIQVQQQLAQSGYYHGAIDGVIGEGTRRAIRSYERANGLHVDGQIDDQLLSTMGLG